MNLGGKNKVNADFSLASMTDIVFLLLVFFLLTLTVKEIKTLDVQLPNSEGDPTPQDPMSVSINNTGMFFVNNNPVAADSLEVWMMNEVRNTQDSSFVLLADRESLHKDVVLVMSIAKKNGLKMVIATDPNEESTE